MTKEEIILYRKCMRKRTKKKITHYEYELEHEYNSETNSSEYEKL